MADRLRAAAGVPRTAARDAAPEQARRQRIVVGVADDGIDRDPLAVGGFAPRSPGRGADGSRGSRSRSAA